MTGLKFEQQLKGLFNFIKQPKEPSAIIGVAFYTIFVMFLVCLVSSLNMKWGVYTGDRLIAVVDDAAGARTVIDRLLEESAGSEKTATQLQRVYLKKTRLTGPVVKGNELRLAIIDAVTSKTDGTQIVVDGKAVLALSSRAEAEQVLNDLKSCYAVVEGRTGFVEDVRLVDGLVERFKLVSVDRALEILKNGSSKTATYLVKEGDTLWDISARLGVPVDKLIASNPGFDPETIKPGDTLRLERTEPLINVETVLTRVSVEQIDRPVEEKQDSSLFKGERKVVDQGKNGKREATYRVVMRNGAEVSREIINEVILEQPKPKVIATGTKVLLASRGGGSGRLAWPAPGSVVSPYGKRGGDFHDGIDIAAGHGTAIAAAESGKVIRSGWYGGYGKCVDISHGDGVVTRYAHMSSINVGVGQRVSRGQLIGRVGSTGNSTGPHLHFEVIMNGKSVNPMKFL